jgi:hypothetical protein
MIRSLIVRSEAEQDLADGRDWYEGQREELGVEFLAEVDVVFDRIRDGRNMTRIPKFKTLDEAAEFWESHDFEDYVDDTEPALITVKMARRKKTLMVPLDSAMYR